MKITLEHIIIAILSIAVIYYIVTHYSLLSDLSRVPDNVNPQLKAVKDKHCGVDMGNLWFCSCCWPK